MILQDPPRPLRELRPDVPDGLQWVVLRCLEKNRDARFSSIAELAASLAPFGPPSAQRSAERIARVLGGMLSGASAAQSVAVVRTGTATDGNFDASREPKKSRGALFVALPLVVLVLGGGAYFALHKPALGPAAEVVGSAQVAAPPASAVIPVTTPVPARVPDIAPADAVAAASAPPGPAVAPPVSAHPALPTGRPAAKLKPGGAAKPAGAPAIDPLDGRQ
jgi:serine/threonine-protein kinase